ncbi:Sulfotransferase domain protein [Candidatus Brocadiaceae bacterium B188]|nr:sulfotransferase domain-containing protein [Candidatus Brocadia sapporoensis]QQR66452.1 MAG: sulfotransferase domain-containing protein [Candidatus Brocadia sp.]RZV58765.1 MAG: hypothetical protein EX330_05470 [Candidatus Brocadia sp. BROELEC01]TWU53411.1 Sulfotransferase domain protein [Candidatus Brocadiaceae bacterium B188]
MTFTGYQTEVIKAAQDNLYSKKWDEYSWNGERLYPVMASLEEILKGSTARIHTPCPPHSFNVLGTPRCGTMWAIKIVSSLLNSRQNNIVYSLIKRISPSFSRRYEVNHYHEGIIEDFKPEQKVVFVYRDIRDAIVSGYFYITNNQHEGTMGCTPAVFRKLTREEGIEKQLIMYMKYRMPVMNYWLNVRADNVVKVKYEDLLGDREKWIRYINERCHINSPERIIRETIEKTSFETMSGRNHGVEDAKSHQRKGISGDWKNHFTEKHMRTFREMGGEEFLRSVGYSL